MKYGFYVNQIKAVELGLNFQQTLLITCIHDLMGVSKYEKNDKHEVFITHSIFLEEYPLLGFKGRTSFYNKFKELEELGFITKSTMNLKQNHKKNFYGLTAKSDELFTNVQNSEFTNVQKNNGTNVQKNEHNQYTIINNTIKEIYKEKIKDKEVLELFEDFLEFRKKNFKIKETERTIKLLLNKLENHSKEEQIKMIEESFVNNWKSFYPKEEPKTAKPSQAQISFAKNLGIENATDYSKDELTKKIDEVKSAVDHEQEEYIKKYPWTQYYKEEYLQKRDKNEISMEEWKRFKLRMQDKLPLCKGERRQ